MAKAFKYRGRDAASVHERANQQGGTFDSFIKSSVPSFRPKENEYTVRIMPPTWVDDEKMLEKWGDSWGIELYVHRNVGPEEDTYLCLQKMLGKPCPVCEMRADLLSDGAEADAKKIQLGKTIGAYIIDRAAEKIGPQVWTMPATKVEKELAILSIEKKSGKVLLIDHQDKGYDISFRKTGTGLNTDYKGVQIIRPSCYLSDDQDKQDKWLDFIMENPLPTVLHYYDYEYLKKLCMGKSSRKDEKEEEEPEPRRRRASREEEPEEEEKPRRRRSAEPEEEEEAPRRRSSRAEPEEEQEDEPKPRSRRASSEEDPEEPAPRRRRAEPEQEEERPRRRRAEVEEPEEEEEPAPRRRRAEPEDDPEEEKPRRRRAEPEEEEEEVPSRARSAETSSRRDGAARSAGRARTVEEDEPKGGTRERVQRKRVAEPEEEEEEAPKPRRRERSAELDDEIPFDGGKEGKGKKGPSAQAKASISRLRDRHRE